MLKLEKHVDYRPLLSSARTIAIVGLSPKVARPSNMVARYLIGVGYVVIPVNPGQDTILNLPCYPDLPAVTQRIDIVNIFRRSEAVLPIVQDAIALGVRAIWMQQGVVNSEAAKLASEHGLEVIMDRCVKIDHMQLFPSFF